MPLWYAHDNGWNDLMYDEWNELNLLLLIIAGCSKVYDDDDT